MSQREQVAAIIQHSHEANRVREETIAWYDELNLSQKLNKLAVKNRDDIKKLAEEIITILNLQPERGANPVEILIRTFDGCHSVSGDIDMRAKISPKSQPIIGCPRWHNACFNNRFTACIAELETKLVVKATRTKPMDPKQAQDIAEIKVNTDKILENQEKTMTYFDQTLAPKINSLK